MKSSSVRYSPRQIVLLVLLTALAVASPVKAQKKIYILTDLEGISGVFRFGQTREKDSPPNIQARPDVWIG